MTPSFTQQCGQRNIPQCRHAWAGQDKSSGLDRIKAWAGQDKSSVETVQFQQQKHVENISRMGLTGQRRLWWCWATSKLVSISCVVVVIVEDALFFLLAFPHVLYCPIKGTLLRRLSFSRVWSRLNDPQ